MVRKGVQPSYACTPWWTRKKILVFLVVHREKSEAYPEGGCQDQWKLISVRPSAPPWASPWPRQNSPAAGAQRFQSKAKNFHQVVGPSGPGGRTGGFRTFKGRRSCKRNSMQPFRMRSGRLTLYRLEEEARCTTSCRLSERASFLSHF